VSQLYLEVEGPLSTWLLVESDWKPSYGKETALKRVIRRNQIAASIMKQANIVTDDLYYLVLDHPEYYQPDGTHYNENGVDLEAKAAALRIAEFLPK